MVKIVEVKTKKQQKIFVDFVCDLYKNEKNYVPSFRSDELANFDKNKNASYDECDIIFFLAYKEDKVVGRICGIIQKVYNNKVNEKRARFSRFDFINDIEVAKALLNAVEEWALSKGMVCVHGPMGFNDMDKEGMLVEGFEERNTIATLYNFPYYKEIIEKLGYEKEVGWVEYKIKMPKQVPERIDRLAKVIAKRYNLHECELKSTRKIIKKYSDKIFDLLNQAYEPLYGVVPINKKMKEQIVAQFKLLVNYKYMNIILNENDDVVGFGLTFPYIMEVLQKSRGKIISKYIFELLKTLKHPKVVELVFIAVSNEYRNKGVNALIMNRLIKNLINEGVKYAESNPELEGNCYVQNQWDQFEHVQHKKRAVFIKYLENATNEDKVVNKNEIR